MTTELTTADIAPLTDTSKPQNTQDHPADRVHPMDSLPMGRDGHPYDERDIGHRARLLRAEDPDVWMDEADLLKALKSINPEDPDEALAEEAAFIARCTPGLITALCHRMRVLEKCLYKIRCAANAQDYVRDTDILNDLAPSVFVNDITRTLSENLPSSLPYLPKEGHWVSVTHQNVRAFIQDRRGPFRRNRQYQNDGDFSRRSVDPLQGDRPRRFPDR